MTGIEALTKLGNELLILMADAERQRDQYKAGGDDLQAFNYDMVRLGYERSLQVLHRAVKAEMRTLDKGAH